jgi:hypothetical protein
MKIIRKLSKILRSVLIIMIATGAVLLATTFRTAGIAADLNSRPVAVITGVLLVYAGHTVYLDGSESYDPAGSPIDYQWKLTYSPPGSVAILSSASNSEASFTADLTGVYQVQLIVNNGFTNSKPAYATIRCIHEPYFW